MNVKKFFKRIGLPDDTTIEHNYEFLKKIQNNSILHIPYENFDLLDKKPLSLEEEDLFQKIVVENRGGYCFELNGLLSWFLKEAGFSVKNYLARFLRGEEGVPMRRHRVVSVLLEDGEYICDIGVASNSPRSPLKLEEGTLQVIGNDKYRFEKDEELGWVLYEYVKGTWSRMFSFTDECQFDVDFYQPSFYCETHPDSVFNKYPKVGIKTADGRKSINDREYKVFVDEKVTYVEKDISVERLKEILKKEFFLNV